jgi:hypothetical protein
LIRVGAESKSLDDYKHAVDIDAQTSVEIADFLGISNHRQRSPEVRVPQGHQPSRARATRAQSA